MEHENIINISYIYMVFIILYLNIVYELFP